LSPGQSNADTFRCLDGTCILQAGRCNGAPNCADSSDESGCDSETTHFVPAYMSQSSTCPADFHNDVHFRCSSGQCIEKVGLCNGIDNCDDGSDESHCSGSVHVTVEATSGRTVTVETLHGLSGNTPSIGVFHDREYNFDDLGHFEGKTFIKYSNDDKMTDNVHVMMKLRTLEPLTVYIVKLDNHGLPWLEGEGYTNSGLTGMSFSGVRSTRHKEWDETLLTTDHFAASAVHSKTFPAGTISIPGNNGGDGSFLIFVDRAGVPTNEAPAVGDGAERFYYNLIGSSHVIGVFDSGSPRVDSGEYFVAPMRCSSLRIRAHVQGGSCGDAVVEFNINQPTQNFFSAGMQSRWQALSDVTVISGDVNRAGPSQIWTGSGSNTGWILSEGHGTQGTTFASGYSSNTAWNRCNGQVLTGGETVSLYCVD